MKSLLLFFLVIPFYSWSQTVKPVVSPDYLELINKDSANQTKIPGDTVNSIRSSPVRVSYYGYWGSLVEKIQVKNNMLHLKISRQRTLFITGSFNTRVEAKKANRVPGLQNQFVQGRSQNGNLVWQGPESNELFSYGPGINTLEYDGSNYDYDVNGRLVPNGTGNGKLATPYNNDILQNAFLFSNSFVLQAKYRRGYSDFISTSFKLGRVNENGILPGNRNIIQNGSASVEVVTKLGKVTGSYQSQTTELPSNNRNGFLNRVYQNALLTPISFRNDEGYELAGGQRRYSQFADNPHFLLDNELNKFHQRHKTIAVGITGQKPNFRYSLTQSYEYLNQDNIEHFKPGTAFFEGGMIGDRNRYDKNFNLQANIGRHFDMLNSELRSFASINYVSSFNQTGINYFHGKHYYYKRNANDLAFNFTADHLGRYWESGIALGNKIYTSNTTLSPDLFLPSVGGYYSFLNIFDSKITARLSAAMNHFNSELPLSQSFSQVSLLQYQTQDAFQYLPSIEVESFRELEPIRHRELSLKAELNYNHILRLNAELFQRKISGDVFPLLVNNLVFLQNLATHKNTGYELELNWSNYRKMIKWSSSVSFTSYKSRVTDVRDGYNHLPIAGFNNVHKAIIEGQPLGVIRGKAFLRNADGQVIIGNDGFPLTTSSPEQIGNPHPDFVMKSWNSISRKKLSFSLSLEWKKGGEAWNGTAGVLDYYGRSKSSGQHRNTTGYVFQGVTTSGQVNSTPVNFYDPSLPVTNNRWTRNGFGGIDEEYIQKADHIRINNISVSYKIESRKYIQCLLLSAYANNILVWTPYNGDPTQLLYDRPDSSGLDFFNLPSLKLFGFSATIQF